MLITKTPAIYENAGVFCAIKLLVIFVYLKINII